MQPWSLKIVNNILLSLFFRVKMILCGTTSYIWPYRYDPQHPLLSSQAAALTCCHFYNEYLDIIRFPTFSVWPSLHLIELSLCVCLAEKESWRGGVSFPLECYCGLCTSVCTQPPLVILLFLLDFFYLFLSWIYICFWICSNSGGQGSNNCYISLLLLWWL